MPRTSTTLKGKDAMYDQALKAEEASMGRKAYLRRGHADYVNLEGIESEIVFIVYELEPLEVWYDREHDGHKNKMKEMRWAIYKNGVVQGSGIAETAWI